MRHFIVSFIGTIWLQHEQKLQKNRVSALHCPLHNAFLLKRLLLLKEIQQTAQSSGSYEIFLSNAFKISQERKSLSKSPPPNCLTTEIPRRRRVMGLSKWL